MYTPRFEGVDFNSNLIRFMPPSLFKMTRTCPNNLGVDMNKNRHADLVEQVRTLQT